MTSTSCTYTPDSDFHGVDTFSYTVSDGVDTATATVTVTVDPVNDPPVAADRHGVRRWPRMSTPTRIEVVANDSDVDGDSLTVTGNTEAESGVVACDETSCSYTPRPELPRRRQVHLHGE